VTTPIGSASITVQAVTDAFQNSLTADTDRVLDSLERNFDRTWDTLRHTVANNTDLMVIEFSRASNEIQSEMRNTAQSIERSFERISTTSTDRLEASFAQAARDIAASFERASEQSSDRMDAALTNMRLESERTTLAIQGDADDAGDAIGSEISRGVLVANAALSLLRDGSNRALSSVGSLGSALTGMAGRGVSAFTSLSKAAVAASLGVAAFVQAGAAAVATMEQLAGVALVAPAAILSFAAVTKTLGVALLGVKDAISASFSNDIEAFGAAMEKLQPAAQAAVAGLSGVISRFQSLKGVIQENFFEGLADPLRIFGEAAEEVASRRLPKLSSALGDVAAGFLDAATKSNLFAGLDAVLAKTTSGVAGLQGPLERLAPAFGSLFLVGSGFIDRMYDSIGRLIDRFAVFVTTAAGDGRMEKWIDDSLAGFQQLGRILANIGSIFGSLTTEAGAAGVGILSVLENITQKLDEAFGSDTGQSFLIASFGLLSQVMESLSIVMGPLVELFATFATIMATRLTSTLQTIEPLLQNVATFLGNVGDKLPGLNDQANDLARSGFGLLAEKAGDLFDALAPIGPLFDDFTANLANVGAGFDGAWLDALVTGFADMSVQLSGGVLDILDSLTLAVAALVQELPRLLPIVGDVAAAFGSVLGAAFDATISLIDPLVTMLEELTPALDFVANAMVALIRITGGLLTALMPLVNAVAKITSMFATSLTPAVTALQLVFAAIQPSLQRISDTLGGALTRAFIGLKPGIDAIVAGFVMLLPKLQEFMPPLEQLADALAPLIELLGRLTGELIERLAPAVFKIIGAWVDMRVMVLELLVPMLVLLIDFITNNLEPAFDALLPVVEKVFNGIAAAAELGVSIVRPIMEIFVDIMSVVLPAAFDSAKTAISIAWDAIVVIVQVAWDILSGIFNVITKFLSGDFTGAWNALKKMIEDVFTHIWNFVKSTINNIIDFFTGDAVGRLASAVSNMFEAAWNNVTTWLGNIWESVTGTIDDVIQWFKDLPGKIKEGAGNAKEWLNSMGQDILFGLIDGLKSAASGLKNVVTDNIINPIKGFFSDAFDFGSPSKVSKQWGNWIGEGFAIGMTNTEAEVVKAAEAITRAAAMPGINLTGASLTNPGITGSFTPVSAGATPVAGGGAVFGPGAIQVVFSGVVPSESQAYATGQAVGSGIADELARRDARMAVGTL
jgi:phage-related protein